MGKIKAGIIGAAGYTGGELIRLLMYHPAVEIAFAQSGSNAGRKIASVHADLIGDTELVFSSGYHFDVDVLFFCAGHGEAGKFVAANTIPETVKLIDIGNDFRLNKDAIINGRHFIYGLPELQRDKICQSVAVANPGCFATAIQLGLLPLAKAGVLPAHIHTTGITGSTGAGQSLSATSHFSWRVNNISAYKTLTHQHNAEIQQSLRQLQPGFAEGGVHFVPWRGDFSRGIFISTMVECVIPPDELTEMYTAYYKDHPFTHIVAGTLNLKQVVNTNKCLVQLEKNDNMLVVHSVIDNLIKGASGQAVQNMNLMFDLPETTGLLLKPAAF